MKGIVVLDLFILFIFYSLLDVGPNKKRKILSFLIFYAQSTSGLYRFKRAAFSSQLKSKCGNILAKAAALRITLNVDDHLWCPDHTLTHHTRKQIVY